MTLKTKGGFTKRFKDKHILYNRERRACKLCEENKPASFVFLKQAFASNQRLVREALALSERVGQECLCGRILSTLSRQSPPPLWPGRAADS